MARLGKLSTCLQEPINAEIIRVRGNSDNSKCQHVAIYIDCGWSNVRAPPPPPLEKAPRAALLEKAPNASPLEKAKSAARAPAGVSARAPTGIRARAPTGCINEYT